MVDLSYCHPDAEEAERVAREHVSNYYMTCVEHYEFGDRHFAETAGYASYAAAKQAIDAYGLDAAVDAYVNAQIRGTPEQVVEKYRERREIVGPFEPVMVFPYGGLTGDNAEESFEPFTKEVMPELAAL